MHAWRRPPLFIFSYSKYTKYGCIYVIQVYMYIYILPVYLSPARRLLLPGRPRQSAGVPNLQSTDAIYRYERGGFCGGAADPDCAQ
jgi:hypothetical protein